MIANICGLKSVVRTSIATIEGNSASVMGLFEPRGDDTCRLCGQIIKMMEDDSSIESSYMVPTPSLSVKFNETPAVVTCCETLPKMKQGRKNSCNHKGSKLTCVKHSYGIVNIS